MDITSINKASGKIVSLKVFEGDKLVTEVRDIKNQICCYATPTSRIGVSENDDPNGVVMDGTFSLTGTTLIRESGTYDFTSNMGASDHIKFNDGTIVQIESVTSATELEVRDWGVGDISSAPATFYNTNKPYYSYTGTKSWVGMSLSERETNLEAGTYRKGGVATLDPVGSAYTLRSVLLHSHVTSYPPFSRVLLPDPIEIAPGQVVVIDYEYTLSVDSTTMTGIQADDAITGYPFQYSSEITSDGSHLTIDTGTDHHLLAGDSIEIANSAPTEYGISSIVSNGTTWTVTTSVDHDLGTAPTIDISDCSIAEYNGTHTIATTTSNTVVINNTTSASTANNGTIGVAHPGVYYDGSYTVLDVPSSTSIRITDSFDSFDGTGDIGTPKGMTIHYPNIAYFTANGTTSTVGGYNSSSTDAVLFFADPSVSGTAFPTDGLISDVGYYNHSIGNAFYEVNTTTVKDGLYHPVNTWMDRVVLDINGSRNRFTQIAFAGRGSQGKLICVLNFDHPQTKPYGYGLTIYLTKIIIPDL